MVLNCTLRGLDQAMFLVSVSPIRNPLTAPKSAPECQTAQISLSFSASVNKQRKEEELSNGRVESNWSNSHSWSFLSN